MDIKQLSLLGLMALMVASIGRCQEVRCHRHCNCTVPTDVACENINAIPMPLPDTVIYLTLSNNFIGPILLKFQVSEMNIKLKQKRKKIPYIVKIFRVPASCRCSVSSSNFLPYSFRF